KPRIRSCREASDRAGSDPDWACGRRAPAPLLPSPLLRWPALRQRSFRALAAAPSDGCGRPRRGGSVARVGRARSTSVLMGSQAKAIPKSLVSARGRSSGVKILRRDMKKALWVAVAVAIAAAGAWLYGALMKEEDDTARPVRLLAIAEEQTLDLSCSRSGRIV